MPSLLMLMRYPVGMGRSQQDRSPG